jgi:hypothetical protein
VNPTERAQSAPLGVALLLGITILGTTAVVGLGGVALTDAQESSNLARAEQSMTLFDSQAAQVALGNSDIQTVDFGTGEGTYSVNPNAGEISIVQLDCDDDGDNGADYDPVTGSLGEDDYELDSAALGSVTYETDSGTLAYQGGGVWQKGESEGVGMVSPPEFHYREATLTLPIVLTRGSGGASGSASATVTSPTTPVTVFAKPGQAYPSSSPDCQNSGSTEYLTNPVTDGSMVVRIESEYSKGWGEYFETRTSGQVTYYDNDGDGEKDDVVLIELISLGQIGDFGMPGDGGSVTVSGASGSHSTEEYTIRLRPDDTDSANFNNLQWTMYAEEGNNQLEIHLKKSGSGGCPSTGITADATIYYSDDGGTNYQGWHMDDAFDAECADLNGDGNDEIYMDLGFVDDEDSDNDFTEIEGDDPALTYTSLSNSELQYFNPNGNFVDTASSPEFSGHGDWESETYSAGDTETTDRLVNHYFAELPEEFDLTVDDKNSDTINEASSSGTLVIGGGGRYVTYLHITKNEVEVEIEG